MANRRIDGKRGRVVGLILTQGYELFSLSRSSNKTKRYVEFRHSSHSVTNEMRTERSV